MDGITDPCANQGHLQGVEWEKVLQAQPKEERKDREAFHREKKEKL